MCACSAQPASQIRALTATPHLSARPSAPSRKIEDEDENEDDSESISGSGRIPQKTIDSSRLMISSCVQHGNES